MGTSKFRKGDVVPYIVCKTGKNDSAAQRAFHPEEISEQKLEIDFEYYLSSQVHPVISRLCEPIEGLTAPELAVCLRLDPNRYKSHVDSGDFKWRVPEIDPKVAYLECAPLKIQDKDIKVDTENIAEILTSVNKIQLEKALRNSIQEYVSKFSRNIFQCDDQVCGMKVENPYLLKQVNGKIQCPVVGCSGKMVEEYTAYQLYKQICFYQHIFKEQISSCYNRELTAVYTHLLTTVIQPSIKHNAYSQVIGKKFANYMLI